MLSSLPFNLVSDSCLSLCLLLELLLPEEAENRKKETGGQGVSHFWRQTLTTVHHIKPSESSCESCGTTCHQPRAQFMSICSCTAVSVTGGNTDVSWHATFLQIRHCHLFFRSSSKDSILNRIIIQLSQPGWSSPWFESTRRNITPLHYGQEARTGFLSQKGPQLQTLLEQHYEKLPTCH